MGAFDPIRSYSPDNRFSFTCPIFGAQTEFRSCLKLRDLLWAGQKQEVRRGCQACLHDSKCPIVPIVRETQSRGEDPGYYAHEPRHGALKARHLERIQNVIVMDKTLLAFDVPDAERRAILATNGYQAKLRGKADKDGKIVDLVEIQDAPAPRVRKIIKEDAPAAVTGDLAGAINEAMKGAA